MHITLLLIVSAYALLNFIIGIIHINKSYIPRFNALLFILGSLCLAMIYTEISYFFYILIAGFALIQLGAILNGFHIRGRINGKHQIIRFLFGCLITLVYYYEIK